MIRGAYIGAVGYAECAALQAALKARAAEDPAEEYMLLLEHPKVFTRGRNEPATRGLRVGPSRLEELGIRIVESDRGGQWTYHGPGQLVVYFVLHVRRRRTAIKKLVHRLEEATIRTLAEYHIGADRRAGQPGVWVGDQKIGFIGLNVEGGITTHGIAINVSGDLEPFRYIVPCGIEHAQVTSIAEIVGGDYSVQECGRRFVRAFEAVFGEVVEIVDAAVIRRATEGE